MTSRSSVQIHVESEPLHRSELSVDLDLVITLARRLIDAYPERGFAILESLSRRERHDVSTGAEAGKHSLKSGLHAVREIEASAIAKSSAHFIV